jgi:hypothetical protein
MRRERPCPPGTYRGDGRCHRGGEGGVTVPPALRQPLEGVDLLLACERAAPDAGSEAARPPGRTGPYFGTGGWLPDLPNPPCRSIVYTSVLSLKQGTRKGSGAWHPADHVSQPPLRRGGTIAESVPLSLRPTRSQYVPEIMAVRTCLYTGSRLLFSILGRDSAAAARGVSRALAMQFNNP